MKLCVFQGTFNPIHNAHLRVAEYTLENFGFDKILFIPAARPPHKDFSVEMEYHRLNLVKIATEYNPRFEVSDIEYQREGKSYSYTTIKELYSLYDIDGKINFIIGTDAFEKIESWYESDKLKNIVDFIVFIRENNFDLKKFNYLKEKGYNFVFAKLDFCDISSTMLRESIKTHQDTKDYINEKEREYIDKYELYKN